MSTPAGRQHRAAGGLPGLIAHVTRQYGLGDPVTWTVLTTGYEDCNIDLRAGRARVVVKVLAAARAGIAARTAGLITRAQAAGVRHPRLHRDAAGSLVHDHGGQQLIVMDFDPGRSLYDLRRPPDGTELAANISICIRNG